MRHVVQSGNLCFLAGPPLVLTTAWQGRTAALQVIGACCPGTGLHLGRTVPPHLDAMLAQQLVDRCSA
jgi:hypothetical protein